MAIALRRFILLVIVSILLVPMTLAARQASAEVSGTTYTSPNYGYTVTWPSDWFLIDDSVVDGIDYLWVGDGTSAAQFWGGPSFGTAQQELGGTIAALGAGEGVSDFTPTLDAQGSPIRYVDESRAYAIYTFTQDIGGGTLLNIATHIEIRPVSPGISMAIVFDTLLEVYQANPSVWDGVLSGISINGQPAPDPETGPDAIPEPDSDLPVAPGLLGEPAPALVSEQWRFAVATTTIGAEIPSLELDAKPDREWVALFADVTNWSATDGSFSLREPLVQTAEMDEPFDLAPSSTRQVARLLDLTAQGNSSVDIVAGGTSRVVLVYSIPSGGTDAQLLLGEHNLPIADTFDLAFEPSSLPTAAGLPEFQEGTITGFSSGSLVMINVAGIETEVSLIGADIPIAGSCYALQALAELSQYVGSPVLLESDPALTSESDRYVWIVNADGSKVMMNQQLIENGAARLTSVPNAARFASWLQSAESAAQQSGSGLWTTCDA